MCLGAQILSEILGGRIYPNSEPEVGWISLDLHPNAMGHSVASFSSKMTKVLSWHQDTCDLPQGARLLASTPVCHNQIFEYGHALGLQFHIEVPEDPFTSWFAVRQHEMKQHITDIEAFQKETLLNLSNYHKAVKQFMDSWLKCMIFQDDPSGT